MNTGQRKKSVCRSGWKRILCLGTLLIFGAGRGFAATDFITTADTYVDQASPTVNNGTNTTLNICSGATSNERTCYLKFSLTGLTGTVVSAKLVLYSTTVSNNVTVYSVPDTSWSETNMTWNNKPATGAALDTFTCAAASYCTFDVTAAVASDGTYAFCLKDYTNNVASDRFKSRENTTANQRPVLQVTTMTGSYKLVAPTNSADDAVVATVVMDSTRIPNPNVNCATAINNAMIEAANSGGGIVYLPAGTYLCSGTIDMQPNVTLRGDWGSVAGTNKTVRGTVIKITNTSTTRAFIKMARDSGLSHLTFWYPNQSLTNVIVYQPTIDSTGTSTEEMTIENINLVNSYVGIAPQANAVRAHMSGIYGSPLSLGMFQKTSSDIPVYTDINFSADYWSGSGLTNAPAKTNLQAYLRANATGVKVAASDNILAAEWHVADYNKGFYFMEVTNASGVGQGTINGNLYGLTASNCVTGLLVDRIGPTFFINCSFAGTDTAMTLNNPQSGTLLFNGCTFSSGSDYDIDCNWSGNLTYPLTFQHCTFAKKILAGSMDLAVVDSIFSYAAGPTICLSNKTGSAILAGNTFAYTNAVLLGGISTNIVARDDSPTFSKVFAPFDIHGYNPTRKPASTNLIVMGSSNRTVYVDGTTDDAPAIQAALTNVAALGGGVVFLPQLSTAGYAIRTPLNVPAGVELRSSCESTHTFQSNASGCPLGGALLQIYYGRNGSIPAITLNAGSGLKGFTVHYPEQFASSLTPYSFTVKATGDYAYVQNMQFVNSYDEMEFNGSDNFLVDTVVGEHIHRFIKAVNCVNGRAQFTNVRDEWDSTGYSTYDNSSLSFGYALSNSIPYEVIGCTNQEIFATFERMSIWQGGFTNSTVHALQFSCESCCDGIKVGGIPAGGKVELIGTSMRFNNDIRQPVTGFDITTAATDGDFRMFSSLIDGYPDTLFAATDADCTFQQCWMDLGDRKIATDGIRLAGSNPGIFRIENCPSGPPYLSTDIANANNKRLELVGNLIKDGIEYAPYQSRMQMTVNPASLSASTRIAEVANLVTPAVAVSMNLTNAGNSGMTLLTTNYVLETRDISFKQSMASVAGYFPTGSPQDLLFQVTAQLFVTNKEPSSASINFMYYDSQAGQIAVTYQLPGNTNWISATNITLTGGGDTYVVPPNNGATNPYWLLAQVPVPGTVFKLGAQVKLNVNKGTNSTGTGKAVFSYVTLQSTSGYLPLPFDGVLNHAPSFTAKPMTRSSAAENTAYTGQTLSGSATDADAGDTLTYSLVSTPVWLNVATNGDLSGTPAGGSAGTNSFSVRVTDAGGMYDESGLNIYVVNTTVQPNLGSVLNGTNLTFSWPGSMYTGWTLDYRTNLLSGVWTAVAGSQSNSTVTVPVNPSAPAGFYRLRYP